jgi:hypothetical protein
VPTWLVFLKNLLVSVNDTADLHLRVEFASASSRVNSQWAISSSWVSWVSSWRRVRAVAAINAFVTRANTHGAEASGKQRHVFWEL